jgi:thiosulfate/3-mercaptopyruvate sulfurtransferase
MLLEPAELERSLKQPALRILDTRPQEAYGKGHIPGAVRVDVAAWQALGKSEGGFQNAKAWGEKVSELGIGADTRVVVYGNSLPETARIWWLLKYVGVADATILDGGWDLWLKEGRPADSATPRVAAARFVPTLDAGRLEEMEPLKKSLQAGKVKVVDTRSPDEFTGKDVRGKRGGHIPGATHLEWKELVAGDGRFKTPDQLRQLFRERGILPEATAVCY